jgi:two-component system cell cycle response regulator
MNGSLDPHPPLPASNAPVRQAPLILIVDDLTTNLKVLRGLLADQAYQLTFANSGQQALDRVQKTRPDLILLDLMMPGMNGITVCRRLKQSADYASIPIIFLTASHELEHLIQAFELGAVDYVTKPFRTPELLARIQTHLKLVHLQRHSQR